MREELPERQGRSVGRDAHYLLVRDFLERHCADSALTVGDVATRQGMSRRYLEGLFAEHGHSPAAHLRSLRLDRARYLLLRARRLPVADVALRAGFNDAATFTRAFHRAHGATPAAWRRQQVATGAGGTRGPVR